MGDQLSNQNMISAVMVVVVVVDYYDRYTKEAIRQFRSLLVEIKQYWGTWYRPASRQQWHSYLISK